MSKCIKRDFTEETENKIIQYAKDSGTGFTDWFGDRYLDLVNLFGGDRLEEDMSNVNSYHKALVDRENLAGKIGDIFANVQNINTFYTNNFETNKNYLTNYDNILRKFADSINQVDFMHNFNSVSFKASIKADVNALKYLDWMKIVNKSADSITDEEYEMLAIILMTTDDPYIMNHILNACYSPTSVKSQDVGGITTIKVVNTSNGKLEKICEEMQYLTLVKVQYGQMYADDIVDVKKYNDDLYKDMQRTSMMKSIITNNPSIPVISQTSVYDKNIPAKLVTSETLFDVKYIDSQITVSYYETDTLAATTDASHVVQTTNFPSRGISADILNDKSAESYISQCLGVPDNAYTEGVKSEIQSQVWDKLIGVVEDGVEGFSKAEIVIDTVSNIADGLEAQDQVSSIKNIHNFGNVSATFNLVCVSTKVNEGGEDEYQFMVYPSTVVEDGEMTTEELWDNFKNNLFYNHKYDKFQKYLKQKDLHIDDINDDNIVGNVDKLADIINALTDYAEETNSSSSIIYELTHTKK